MRVSFNARRKISKVKQFSKEESSMSITTIADWLTVLFLLWFGLKKFIPALDTGLLSTLGAILALGAAVFIALSSG
jgi:hypothetical protein